MSKSKSKQKKEKINFRHNISEYWNLIKKYKMLLLGTLFLSLFVELLLVVDKFLFKIIIDNGTSFIEGAISQQIFIKAVVIVALIFGGVLIARPVAKYFSLYFLHILEADLIIDLKVKYFNHVVRLSHNFHTTHKVGALISKLQRGAGAIENLTDVVTFQFFPLLFNLAIVGFSLAYFSMTPALVLLGVTILFVSYSFYIQQIQQDSKLKYNHFNDSEKGFVSDVFTNLDSIKYFGKEKNIGNLFSKIAGKTKIAMRKYWGYSQWFEAGHLFILGVGTFFLIYFPIKDFLAGQMTLGTLVFIFTVYGNVIGPLLGFVWGMRSFYNSMADLEDLFEYGKIKNEIEDQPNAKELKITEGTIEFRNILFNYEKKKAFCLDDFNLKINKGEKVALVGHSGCGKTTLIKLLYRLFDVGSGKILIDGKDVRNFKQESVRSELSIVPQECVLFDDTIFNNIKFSNPTASKEDVWNSIKFAQLDRVISNFPLKEKTIVGERGIKLSGGEKQRVSIARAVLADRKVLVLDEATSALDSETEYDIQFALEKLLKGRTSIIIAHRLSTIMNADRIIVMKKGKIIQEGKHEDLIQQDGEYRKLWDLQKGGYVR